MLPRKIIMPLSMMQNTKSIDTVSNYTYKAQLLEVRVKTVNFYSPCR